MTEFASATDAGGWIDGARRVPSPNHDERPFGSAVRLIVVHSISLPPGNFGGRAIEQLFTNQLDPEEHPYFSGLRGLRVSAHFLIRRDGELLQFVATPRRAWHAGASCWRGVGCCNDFSLGIELEGDDDREFTEAQYHCLAGLLRLLRSRYPIEEVLGHHDIAPGRKTDPGPMFDWRRIGMLCAD